MSGAKKTTLKTCLRRDLAWSDSLGIVAGLPLSLAGVCLEGAEGEMARCLVWEDDLILDVTLSLSLLSRPVFAEVDLAPGPG